MFEITRQVSNKKLGKDHGVCLVTGVSKGLIRLTPKATTGLGVSDINRIVVMEVKLTEGPLAGEKRPAIFISPFAHIKDTASGKFELDAEEKMKMILTNENAPKGLQIEGRKLGYPNGQNGNLQFSDIPSWELLSGTTEGTNYWKILGLKEDEKDFVRDYDGVKVYVLEEQKDKYTAKQARAEKAADAEDDEELVDEDEAEA